MKNVKIKGTYKKGDFNELLDLLLDKLGEKKRGSTVLAINVEPKQVTIWHL